MDGDLCNRADVKFFGGISGTLHDSRIDTMITYMSKEVKSEAEDQTLTSDNFDANMACIYGVLTWLEQDGRIKSVKDKKQIAKISDLHVSVEYDIKKSSSSKADPYLKSFSERFEGYISKLRPLPCAGSYDDGQSNYIVNSPAIADDVTYPGVD